METVKVKSWSADQGEFVLINAADFDPAVHEAFDPDSAPAPAKAAKAQKKAG